MRRDSVANVARSVRVGVIQNPTAGSGRAGDVSVALGHALRQSGFDVIDLSAGDMSLALGRARAAVAEGLAALAVVGGDGMVHLGVQVVARTATPLLVVPAGTGNDFAVAAGIDPSSRHAIAHAVRALRESRISSLDLLRVTGDGIGDDAERWVAGAVSAGLDAAVNARANRMRFPRGEARYVVAALAEIAAYRAWSYRVTISGAEVVSAHELPGIAWSGGTATWAGEGALLTLANSPRIGGGMPIAPGAIMVDGLIDVVIAGDVGNLGAGRLFPQLLKGDHLASPEVMLLRGSAVELSHDGAHVPELYGDGEFLGTSPVTVEVVPGALSLLA